jgi:hypothetical protein
LGTPYDRLGAFRARDLPIGRIRRWLLGRENLTSLFCSEFVASVMRILGLFATDNASAWNPNSLIRALRREKIVGERVLLSSRRMRHRRKP